MLIPLIRTLILYFFIVFSMRFMGKRQVGEMQPAELVITILISAVASVPMQDIELPLIHGIVPIIVLVSAEVLMSSLSLKFPALRKMISGRPITLIRKGIIDQSAMKKLRITIDDLLEDLRLKDVYDLRTVRLAQMETNGRLSVLLESSEMPPSAKDMNIPSAEHEPFEVIVADGRIIDPVYAEQHKKHKWLLSVLHSHGANAIDEVFLFAYNGKDNIIFAKKENR